MTKEEILALYDGDENLLFIDGYDDCIAGIMTRFNFPPIVCYDKTKILKKLGADGMTPEKAEEFFYYNQIGTWVGEQTPCFFTL